MPPTCSTRFERELRKQGFGAIAGVDEAGRGCLFGPVYAAACILDPLRPLRGVNDSKQVSEQNRETLALLLRERSVAWAIGWASAAEIDAINILQASRLAMKRAVENLSQQADYLLVDAISVDVAIPQRGVIHGDALSRSIAAASILAKTARDAHLRELDLQYPAYGFARHKGYGSPEHLAALDRWGPLPEHRYSYAPVRARAGQTFTS